jgi:hypothetical protein
MNTGLPESGVDNWYGYLEMNPGETSSAIARIINKMEDWK